MQPRASMPARGTKHDYASRRHRTRELSDCGNRFVDNDRRRALRMTYSNEISKAIRQRE